MLYLVGAISESMFEENKGAIYRTRTSESEARGLLKQQPFVIPLPASKARRDQITSRVFGILEKLGYDLSRGEVFEGHIEATAGDELLVATINQGKGGVPRVKFALWEVL